MKLRSLLVVVSVIAGLFPAAFGDSNILTLATTTSTQNSGLLDYLHPDFEAKTGIKIKVIARGTGASLQLARQGNADVVLAHDPDAEEQFVAGGYGISRCPVMYNDFVLIGPKGDPAGIQNITDAAAAFRTICEHGCLFVSRGDNSGTHVKEQSLWQASAVPLEKKESEFTEGGEKVTFSMVFPRGDWYKSVGQGMGNVIQYATEKRGYTLSDRGTYYAYAFAPVPRTDLIICCEGDPRLRNPYSVIAVNPAKLPNVNAGAAAKYVEWITSEETQARIAAFQVGGKTLFHRAS